MQFVALAQIPVLALPEGRGAGLHLKVSQVAAKTDQHT
jgi:hypothetical protein